MGDYPRSVYAALAVSPDRKERVTLPLVCPTVEMAKAEFLRSIKGSAAYHAGYYDGWKVNVLRLKGSIVHEFLIPKIETKAKDQRGSTWRMRLPTFFTNLTSLSGRTPTSSPKK